MIGAVCHEGHAVGYGDFTCGDGDHAAVMDVELCACVDAQLLRTLCALLEHPIAYAFGAIEFRRVHIERRERQIRHVEARRTADVDAVRIDEEERLCAYLRHFAEDLRHLCAGHAV